MWAEWDISRAWDEHMHPAVYKIDNQQGTTVQHRELYPIFCDNPKERRIQKRIIYV